MSNNVIHRYGTQAEYDALSKDPNTLYFTVDTQKLYKGEIEIQPSDKPYIDTEVNRILQEAKEYTDGKVEEYTYELPKADADTLGGIKAPSKTAVQTQQVGIDAETSILYVEQAGMTEEQKSTYLQRSGGEMTGEINMGSHKIISLNTPTNNADATNKEYVDAQIDEAREYTDSKTIWLTMTEV